MKCWNIVNLIIWIFVGLNNLIFFKEIDKVSYSLMWIVLIVNLLGNLI